MRKLEVIALNAKDAIAIEKAGADRIELVTDMAEGGLSPKLEVVKEVIEAVNIPVNVMVRLTGGDFILNESELNSLVKYTEEVSKLAINGIVFGSLNESSQVVLSDLKRIVEAANNKEITFHRAIDESYLDYLKNLGQIEGKVTNVLTSGGLEYPIEENIIVLKAASEYNIRVLVGGGINDSNKETIINSLPKCDFHIGSLAYNHGDFEQGINETKIKEVLKLIRK